MLCALVMGSLVPAEAARPVKIKIGTLVPRGSSFHKSLQKMAGEWKTISKGKVRVTIYPDGAQGSERDMVRLMKLGSLQKTLGQYQIDHLNLTQLQN